MKINLDLNVDDSTWNTVQETLNDVGFNIELCFNMFLSRLAKERSLSWITAKESGVKEGGNNVFTTTRMTKPLAAELFAKLGKTVYYKQSFASKNSSGNYYWGNPTFDVIDYDWSLILNDTVEKRIHLFNIPKGTFRKSDLVARTDKANIIDLQIVYGDSQFTDRKSHKSFFQYYVGTIEYK